MIRKPMHTCSAFLGLLLVLSAGGSATAQPIRSEGGSAVATVGPYSAYGVSDLSAVTVAGRAFVPIDSSTEFVWNSGHYTTNGGVVHASIDLPSGALVEGIEMDACDTTSAGSTTVFVAWCPFDGTGTCATNLFFETGDAETPGCATFSAPIAGFPVVNNAENSYVIGFLNETTDGTTKWMNARVYYRRQVAEAPGTATFADVPVGHALHQFVEALAASGITAGCGGGNFCPNNPVTRGQMAVFLAKALGLHWAP